MKCEEAKTLFIEAYYRELDADRRKEFEEHLRLCADCAKAYNSMLQTLSLMDKRNQPDSEKVNSTTYWETVKTTIEKGENGGELHARKGKTVFLHPAIRSSWVYGIAAAVLIALGVFLGRTLFTPLPQIAMQANAGNPRIADSTAIAQREVDREVVSYLDRSKVLLQGIVNAPPEISSEGSLPHQQQLSRDLIQQANYLKTALKEPDQENMRKLIGDLEVVLMQLANYSNQSGVPLIELVKQGVDKKSILLKINLEQIKALGATEKEPHRSSKNDRKL